MTMIPDNEQEFALRIEKVKVRACARVNGIEPSQVVVTLKPANETEVEHFEIAYTGNVCPTYFAHFITVMRAEYCAEFDLSMDDTGDPTRGPEDIDDADWWKR